MKKRLISLFCLIAVSMVFTPATFARLAKNDRAAVVHEAFNALDPVHNGQSYKDIPHGSHNYVSIWNYLESDRKAYETLKKWYRSDASVWPSYFSDLHSYGYGRGGGYWDTVGRGGQCKHFANLVVYRSDSYTNLFPPTKDMLKNGESDLSKAVPGDILVSPDPHIAIIVAVQKSGKKVTALDVIDSNFVTDINDVKDREVIARHVMDLSYLQKHKYVLWKGITYYNKPYSP